MKRLFLFVLSMSCCVFADTFFVSTNSASDGPGTAWSNAFHTIQGAVDAASASNDIVLVTNGIYNTGGAVTPGYACLNRVVITNAITVRSVNGPEVTHIVGAEATGGGLGDDAVRGVFMSTGILSGFTVTNGHTRTEGHYFWDKNGGGIMMYDGDGVVSNCFLFGNSARYGGGSRGGTLNNCTLSGNSAAVSGGGNSDGILNNCILSGNSAQYDGGGSVGGTLNDCILLGNSAAVSGGGSRLGTLNNCTLSGNSATNYGGGSNYGTLNNCTLSENSAARGGGSVGGTLNDCILSGNSATERGGGSYDSTLNNCTLSGNSAAEHGGGIFYGTLNNCTLTGNSAASRGGGSSYGILNNCILSGNSATNYGGGSRSSTLNNCTLTGNSAASYGGGSCYGILNNCIIWSNTAPIGANWHDSTPEISYSCTTPLPSGNGNVTNDPAFIDAANGNVRLKYGSPCIDTGDNAEASGSPDLDSNDRIVNGTVDMGAYEYHSGYDSDGDTRTDGDEYIADTGILNSNDYFRVTSFSNGVVFFDSSNARWYTLLGCTNLLSNDWKPVQAARMGTGGSDSVQSTNNVPQEFYKLTVELP